MRFACQSFLSAAALVAASLLLSTCGGEEGTPARTATQQLSPTAASPSPTASATAGSAGLIPWPLPVDWKIYRNEEYGFEVRYPPDFNVTESESYQSVTFESKRWEGNRIHNPCIIVDVQETTLSVLEWLDQNRIFGPLYRDEQGQMYIYSGRSGTLTKEPVETLTIDGAEAIKFFWWGVSGGGDHVLVKNRNEPSLLYDIERHLAGRLHNPEETVPKELFGQMLSTFKFLD